MISPRILTSNVRVWEVVQPWLCQGITKPWASATYTLDDKVKDETKSRHIFTRHLIIEERPTEK